MENTGWVSSILYTIWMKTSYTSFGLATVQWVSDEDSRDHFQILVNNSTFVIITKIHNFYCDLIFGSHLFRTGSNWNASISFAEVDDKSTQMDAILLLVKKLHLYSNLFHKTIINWAKHSCEVKTKAISKTNASHINQKTLR